MSRKSQSKRMQFNAAIRFARQIAKIRRDNPRRFVGVIHGLEMNGKPIFGMGAAFIILDDDEPVTSLMQPRSTTYIGPWCCEKGEALHVRVCPECAEINDWFQSCLGLSPEEIERRKSGGAAITESEGGEV